MSLSLRASFPTFAERTRGAVIIVGAVLALATLAIYLPATQMTFIAFDDPDYVWRNPRVVGGLTWEGVWWSLSHAFASNWHPLTWMSHMLDFQLYGLNAGGHHATNVLFHIGNTVLLFVLLREMTGALWRSALVAALFALHPVHVESVAWIAERKDVLSAFFGLLCLWAYGRYRKTKSGIQNSTSSVKGTTELRKSEVRKRLFYYCLALAFFALGLMSKPMLVTLPCVMLLLDFWPLKRTGRGACREEKMPEEKASWWPLVIEKIPFFALAVVSSIVTCFAQSRGGSMWTFEALPLETRVANVFVSYVRYLGKTIWPTQLCVVYPYQEWSTLAVTGAGLIVTAISVLAIRQWRNRKYLTMGWLWFLGMLVPVIGIVQVGSQAMADRYMYLPAIGLFVMVAWGAAEIGVGWSKEGLMAGVAVVLIAICMAVTQRQIGFWQNSESLFARALTVNRNNFVAYNNLGYHYGLLGELNLAQECYRKSLEINPRSQHALAGLALVLSIQKKSAEAIEIYDRCLRIWPHYATAHVNLANLLFSVGRTNDAIMHYEEAIRMDPQMAEAHQGLAGALSESGQFEGAREHFQAALQLRPHNAYIHCNFAGMLVKERQLDEAAAEYKIALGLDPQFRPALNGLGELFMACGELDRAVQQFSDLLRLTPDEPEANYRYALALTRQGHVKEAVEHYRRGLRQIEDSAEALNNLAWILATNPDPEVRNGADAVKFAEKACKLTAFNKSIFVGTLAAAYAEANRFSDAIATAEKARLLAEAANENEIAARNLKLIELYRAQKPCRDVP
jgi:protein O-mannosyl-transferase